MKFVEPLDNEVVRRVTPDHQHAQSLLKMSKNNLLVVKQIPLTDDSASLILSSAYESLRQVLEAIALKNGYKVFSHVKYTSYLEQNNEQAASKVFDRLRKLRNGVNYYGNAVPKEVTKQALQDIQKLCKQLEEKYC